MEIERNRTIQVFMLLQWSLQFLDFYLFQLASISGQKTNTVYPKKYAQGFVVLCFAVVMQSFIMNSHEVFVHIHQGCFAGTGAIVRSPQCQWSKPDGYGKISQCITTTKHSKAKTVCMFLGIYCTSTPEPVIRPSLRWLPYDIYKFIKMRIKYRPRVPP